MAASARDWICRNRMTGSASGAAVVSMARDSVRAVPILAPRADPMRQRADPVDPAGEGDLGAAAVRSQAEVSAVAADAAVDAAASADLAGRGDAVAPEDGIRMPLAMAAAMPARDTTATWRSCWTTRPWTRGLFH